MKSASKFTKALPLAAALLLGGCDVSPLEVETVSRNRIMWVEDERETDVHLLRLTSPVDSLAVAAVPGEGERGNAH
jgi:hypothetical protein